MDLQRPLFSFRVLFRVSAVGACPVLRRFQEGGVAVGADVFQRLLVLAVFVAGVVEEGLNDLAGLVLPTVSASDVASGQAALLHLAPGPAQVPGAVQIPRLAAFAGVPILPAGPAVGTAAADLLCSAHGKDLFSVICRGYISGASGFRTTPHSQREKLPFRMLSRVTMRHLLHVSSKSSWIWGMQGTSRR